MTEPTEPSDGNDVPRRDQTDCNEPMDARRDAEQSWLSRRHLLGLVGASAAAGLSGIQLSSGEEAFDATPMGLSVEGMGLLNHETFEYEQLPEELEIPEADTTADVRSHLVIHGASDEEVEATDAPEAPFPITFEPDRNVGVLSTPTVEVDGRKHNPLATAPLREVLASERGRSMLARLGAVDGTDFEWSQRPALVATTEAELLGTTTRIETHFGAVDQGEAPDRLVLAHAARVEHEDDAVIVVGARARSARGASACVDGEPGAYEIDHECMARTIEDIEVGVENTLPCPTTVASQADGRCGDGVWPPYEGWPKIEMGNLRLVQKVEDTAVVNGGSHTEPDPDLVEGDETVALFEFTELQKIGEFPNVVDVQVVVHKSNGSNDTYDFRITDDDLEDIENGTAEIAKFHEMSNDSSRLNDLPVFQLSDDVIGVEVEVAPNSPDVIGDVERSRSVSTESVGPLIVGFMQIRDSGGGSSHPRVSPGDNYGDSNGWVRDYERTVNTVVEYLQRTYPGPVIGYRHDAEYFWGGMTEDDDNDGDIDEEGSQSIGTDLKDVRKHLDHVANTSALHQGTVYPDDYATQSTAEAIIEQEGFDATAAIVPNDVSSNTTGTSYFDHHGKDYAGVFWNHNTAVAVTGGSPTGQGRWISHIGAQEFGHYFQNTHYHGPSGHPLAQRDDDGDGRGVTVNGVPVDFGHARHQNSDLRDRDIDNDGTIENWEDSRFPPDAPGVASIAYDLDDGTFTNVQQFEIPNGNFSATGPSPSATSIDRVESFMSYSGGHGQLWTDARQHQDMIDHGWEWPNQSGSGSSGPVLSAAGIVAEDGTVEYTDVAAYQGFQRYVEYDDAPVQVTLVDPNGERLEEVHVPDTAAPSHGEPTEGLTDFLLPYPPETAVVRTEYEGSVSRMNPIERSVRDEIGRVPDAGYRDDSERRRERIEEALDRVAAQMAEGQYEAAAETMAAFVRPEIGEGVRDDYSDAVNDPDRSQLLALVDDAVERLTLLAEVN